MLRIGEMTKIMKKQMNKVLFIHCLQKESQEPSREGQEAEATTATQLAQLLR